MVNMFADAVAFNQSIGTWNTSKVIDMGNMFSSATSFNQPIGNWNTINVTNMSFMFGNATSFNQPIGNWNVQKVNTMRAMFEGAGLCTGYYDNLLNGWGAQSVSRGYILTGAIAIIPQRAPLDILLWKAMGGL